MTFIVRDCVEEDNPQILEMLRDNELKGAVSLIFGRDPNYFYGARVATEDPTTIVLFDPDSSEPDQMLGLMSGGFRTLYINGEPRRIRYAADLRLDERVRGQGGAAITTLYSLARIKIQQHAWGQAVILSDNKKYMNSFLRKRDDMPDAHATGDIETSLIYGRTRKPRGSGGLTLRAATEADIPTIQAFHDQDAPKRQFYQKYDFSKVPTDDPYFRDLAIDDYWLAFDGPELVGMLGVWDQKGFKQTTVAGYSGTMKFVRPMYNAWCKLSRGMPLPPAGGSFKYLMIHSILIKNNDPHIFDELLALVHRKFSPVYDAIIAGFFVQDPLKSSVERYSRRTLGSRHFLVTYERRDVTKDLDERLPYVEIARL